MDFWNLKILFQNGSIKFKHCSGSKRKMCVHSDVSLSELTACYRTQFHVDLIKSHLVLSGTCTLSQWIDPHPSLTSKANKQLSHADQGEVKLLLLAPCSLL